MLSLLQGLSLLLALSPLASAADVSPLYNVTMTVVMSNGRGCPDGTVSSALSEDGTVATFGFDAHETYFGPSYPPSRKVQDCIVNLQFDFPLGFRYIFVDSTYHGSARLAPGMEATVDSKFYSATAADEPIFGPASTRVNVAGAMDGEYTETGVMSTRTNEYDACGRTTVWTYLTNRILVMSAAAASGRVVEDTATSLEKQQLRLSWLSCT
jgi:hypothetical protein